MIVRINLHPNRKIKTKTSSSQLVTPILAVLFLLVVGGCAYMYMTEQDKITVLESEVSKLQGQRDELKKNLSGVEQLKKDIDAFRSLQVTFAKLTALRKGPQYVLNEFSRVLSNPRDVVARKTANEQKWVLSWEPDNIIINKWADIGNGQIQINGTARSMDDITEFWKRMKTSSLMRNVILGEITSSNNSSLNIKTQTFSFTAEVNFNYQTEKGVAMIESMNTPDTETKKQ